MHTAMTATAKVMWSLILKFSDGDFSDFIGIGFMNVCLSFFCVILYYIETGHSTYG